MSVHPRSGTRKGHWSVAVTEAATNQKANQPEVRIGAEDTLVYLINALGVR